MTNLRVTLEIGPKGKRAVAVAPDWPGLERGAKTEEDATDLLRAYMPRYSPVAKLATMDAAFDALEGIVVVEQYPGTGSTDFRGISFAFSSIDKQEMSEDELERELNLMRACWAFFDDVRRRVSAEMQKGPRGGGRDRDQIVRHTFAAEQQWGKKIGVLTPDGAMLSETGLKAHRDAYCHAIRDYHSQGKPAGKVAKWPLRYLIRHTAFHTMDHAWEMEDKDLTNLAQPLF
ncbi:MAG: hypothetical protein AAF633_14285 [Chloroflexota bacterium]